MKATRRRLEITAIVIVIATFVGLYLYAVAVDPPENATVAHELAILMAIPATLWAAAAWLFVHHWWAAVGVRLSTMDPPGRVLAAAVAALPEHRRDWGAAMLAELPEVHRGRRGRRNPRRREPVERHLLGARAVPVLVIPFGVLGAALGASAGRSVNVDGARAPTA